MLLSAASWRCHSLCRRAPAQRGEAKPQCVVSLSPTATETLFAIGAGKQVQAVDTDSDYPTKGLPEKRINALDPSVESVIGICKVTKTHPISQARPRDHFLRRERHPAEAHGSGHQGRCSGPPDDGRGRVCADDQLGKLTGHASKARQSSPDLKVTIAQDVASVPKHPNKGVTVYYELDPTFYSFTSNTFVGCIAQAFGVTNIADAENTSADAGYPQLSAEYIVSANPKLIFLADTICCHASAGDARQAARLLLGERGGATTTSSVERRHRLAVGSTSRHLDERPHGRREERAGRYKRSGRNSLTANPPSCASRGDRRCRHDRRAGRGGGLRVGHRPDVRLAPRGCSATRFRTWASGTAR